MNEMTLPFRNRTRNLSPGVLRPSTLAPSVTEDPHYILNLYEGAGKKHFVSLKLECQSELFRCSDNQLQVNENCPSLLNVRSNICKS